MFASIQLCNSIAIFHNVNPTNSRFCICPPMNEPRLDSDLWNKRGSKQSDAYSSLLNISEVVRTLYTIDLFQTTEHKSKTTKL